jgi:hypothetical protein
MTFVWCPFIHSATDLRLTFHLGQMESSSNIGRFSKPQVCIFKALIGGSSNTSICKIFKGCTDEAILGFFWY